MSDLIPSLRCVRNITSTTRLDSFFFAEQQNMPKNQMEESDKVHPLANAICQRDKLITNVEMFLGCTVNTFKRRSDESVMAIRGYADHIDEVANKCNTAEYRTCMTKGVWGVVTIGSLLIAPTTGGTSLFIATGASVVGAIAVYVGKNASTANLRCEQDLGEKAKVASERVIAIIKTFHKLLTEYDDVLIKAKNYLKTSEGIMLFSVLETSIEPKELTLRSFIAKAIKSFGSKTKLMEYIVYIGQYGIASTATMASSLFLSQAVNDGGLGIWRLFDQTSTKQNNSLIAVKLREYAKSIEDSTEALLTQYVKCTKVIDGKRSARQAQTAVRTSKVNPTYQNNIEKCTKMQTKEITRTVQPQIEFHEPLKRMAVSTSRGNIAPMVNLDHREMMKVRPGKLKVIVLPTKPYIPDTDKLKMNLDPSNDRCTNRKIFEKASMTMNVGKRTIKIRAETSDPDVLKVTVVPTKLQKSYPVKLKMTADPSRDSRTRQNDFEKYTMRMNVGKRQLKLEANLSDPDKLKVAVTRTNVSCTHPNNFVTYTMAVYFDKKEVRARKFYPDRLKATSASAKASHVDLNYSEKYKMTVDLVKRKIAVRATIFDPDKLKAASVTTADCRVHQKTPTTKIQACNSSRPRNSTSDHATKAHYGAVVDHCVFCGESNHSVDQCWHGRQVMCYRCHSLGHKSKFCPV